MKYHSPTCPYSFEMWNASRAQGQTRCYCGFDYDQNRTNDIQYRKLAYENALRNFIKAGKTEE